MSDNSKELAHAINEKRVLMVAEARMRVGLVSELMTRNLLQEGTHYSRKGLFGGNSKPSLLLPGAEVIANALGVNVSVDEQRIINNGPFPDGAPTTPFIMFSYEYVAQLQATGVSVTGVGSCNSWEDKYLYRNEWVNGKKRRVEVGYGIYSAMNTLQKMASKRAYIDAVKKAASCSDIFTQDLEDLPPETVQQAPKPQPRKTQRPAPNKVDMSIGHEPPRYVEVPQAQQAVTETLSAKAQRLFPGMDWKAFGANVLMPDADDDAREQALRELLALYPDGKPVNSPADQAELVYAVKEAKAFELAQEAKHEATRDAALDTAGDSEAVQQGMDDLAENLSYEGGA